MSNCAAASPIRSASNAGRRCEPDDLLRLIERLDPDNRPGRLVLIGRFGAANAPRRLPALMRATREAGSKAIWSADPMHGNTVGTINGRKTRALPDIITEIVTFFQVAAAEGVHGGGIHLEMTGEEVTECLGGSRGLREEDLYRRYLTHCDPRLNVAQALDVAQRDRTGFVAARHGHAHDRDDCSFLEPAGGGPSRALPAISPCPATSRSRTAR